MSQRYLHTDGSPTHTSSFEVITTYPGVHAILLQRMAHRLWNLGLLRFYLHVLQRFHDSIAKEAVATGT